MRMSNLRRQLSYGSGRELQSLNTSECFPGIAPMDLNDVSYGSAFCLYIYHIHTPNLGFGIAIPGREREQSRFRKSTEEAAREHERAQGSIEGAAKEHRGSSKGA